MAAYQTGEVERLLDLKSHVLRYWEKVFPILQPRKDAFGRRVYSGRDVQILMRLKHLLHVRRFTVEGAREQLLRELSGADQDTRAIADAARAELVAVYFIARKLRARAAAALGEAVPSEEDRGKET